MRWFHQLYCNKTRLSSVLGECEWGITYPVLQRETANNIHQLTLSMEYIGTIHNILWQRRENRDTHVDITHTVTLRESLGTKLPDRYSDITSSKWFCDMPAGGYTCVVSESLLRRVWEWETKAPICWFSVSHQVLPLHTMWASGYYHCLANRYLSWKKLTSVMARWLLLIIYHCRRVLLDAVC